MQGSIAAKLAPRVSFRGIVRSSAGRYDVGMMSQGSHYWPILALIGAMYVVMCIRVARRMAHIGRSGAAWFFISFFCTALPAAVVLRRHSRRRRAAPPAGNGATPRCRHCGAVLAGDGRALEPPVCPECGMKLGEETLA